MQIKGLEFRKHIKSDEEDQDEGCYLVRLFTRNGYHSNGIQYKRDTARRDSNGTVISGRKRNRESFVQKMGRKALIIPEDH